MQNLQGFLQDKMPELRLFLEKYPVEKLYAFGSVCTERFTPQSDIDLIVDLSEGLNPIDYGEVYWELHEKLPQVLGRAVDLLTPKMLRNSYFIKTVNQTKTLIYERPNKEISGRY